MNSRLLIAAVLALLAITLSAATEPAITLVLEYGDTAGYDDDNDGVEDAGGIIDFTVQDSTFNWQANESNLCTLWRVQPVESETATVACNGDGSCCGFAELSSSADDWNDTFYLTDGQSALVSAKIVHADYSLGNDTSVNIVSTDWATLTGLFVSQGTQSGGITVIAPTGTIASGEKVTVRAAHDGALVYSLDGSPNVTMTLNGSEYVSPLNGTLPGNVLANGVHNLTLFAQDNSSTLEHQFSVADSAAPLITLAQPLNNTKQNGTTFELNLSASTDELSNLSYSINGGATTPVGVVARSANFSTPPTLGANTLLLTATDMHGNLRSEQHTFNFSLNDAGSCEDAVQNYHDGANESGIDCGGPCSACVAFEVSIDKSAYAPGEQVSIGVQARADAQHNITITGPSYYSSFVFNGSTTYIISPTTLGSYAVSVSLTYKNLSPEFIIDSFDITNTLAVTLVTNETTINKNETINFRADVTGNTTLAAYTWDFESDNVTDSTARDVNRTFLNPGSYTVKLNVTSGAMHLAQTAQITVRPHYNVSVNVTTSSGAGISDAIVRVFGEQKSGSLTSYSLPYGTRPFNVSAPGFLNTTESKSIIENATVHITLLRDDDNAPLIALVSPEHNGQVQAPNASFSFSVTDAGSASCTLQLNAGSSWVSKGTLSAPNGDTRSFNITDLATGTYNWRVQCTDEVANTNLSAERNFTAVERLSTSTLSQEEDIAQFISALNDVLSRFNSYEKLEQETVEALRLVDSIEKAKVQLQRTIRDLNNVVWRRFSAEEEREYLDELAQAVESLKYSTIIDLDVQSNSRFVSYPEEADVSAAAQAYLDAQGRHFTSAQRKQFAQRVAEMQQDLVVTTTYRSVQARMYDGEQRTLTLVQKSVDYNGNLSGLVLLESIPKTVAQSVSNVTLLFEHKVVQDDPLVSFTPGEDGIFSYYVWEDVSQDDVQDAITLVVPADVSASASGPTGFAVFSAGPLASPHARLAVEVIIVILLAGLYFAYGRGMLHRESKDLRALQEQLVQLRGTIQHNDYDGSKKLYQTVQGNFRQLNPDERKTVFAELHDLHFEIDAIYVRRRISEANALLGNRRGQDARAVYDELTRVYKQLPAPFKKAIYADCMALMSNLKSAK